MTAQSPVGVMHILSSLGPGGRSQVVLDLVRWADRTRYRMHVAYLDEGGPFEELLLASGTEVISLGHKPGLDPGVVRRLIGSLRDRRIEIVHAHDPSALLYSGLAGRIGRTSTVVATVHRADTTKGWRERLRDRIGATTAHAVVAVSHGARRAFARSSGYPIERVRVIPNGVDFTRVSREIREVPAAIAGRNGGGKPTIVSVARLSSDKDHETLLRAFARLTSRYPRARLILVGDGPERAWIEALARELGIAERTAFLGHRKDVAACLSESDVFVLSTRTEGFGLAALEAMVAGIPVIGTQVGGLSEVIIHGETGLLVPPRDAAALERALVRLVDNPDLAEVMGRKGQARAQEEFGVEQMTRRYEDLYAVHLEQHSKLPPGLSVAGGKGTPRRRGSPAARAVVLHLVTSLNIGGLERVVVDLVRKTDRARFLPIVCGLGSPGPLAREITQSGADVLVMERPERVTPTTILRLVRLFRRERVDVVHVHNALPLFYGAMAAWLAGVPVVYTKHGQRLSYEWVLHRLCNRIVAVSEDIASLLTTQLRVPPSKVVILRNGVDTTRFSPGEDKQERRRALGLPVNGFLVGNVARLAPEKDHENLFRAFRGVLDQRQDAHLVLAGDGTLWDPLLSLVHALDLEGHVHMLGARSDVHELLRALDLFVLSSVEEGLSITLLEAMACGLPIVATDVGGNREVVVHGETGLLVPAKHSEVLADGMLRLISDPLEAVRMGVNGRDRAVKEFDLDQMVRAYLDIYAELLGSASSQR